MFKKVLIADRSENALNVIRTCRELGIESVAVFSDYDFNALHIVLADFCCHLKGKEVANTYGNAEAIIKAAKEHNCDAVFPGSRFFNYDANFANLLFENGLLIVGASAQDISKVANYHKLLQTATSLGLNVIEYKTLKPAKEELISNLQQLGYPALVRFNNLYRNISIVKQEEDVDEILEVINRTQNNNNTVIIQKYLPHTNIIAVKLLADKAGNCVVLHDLDASLQINNKQLIVQGPILKLSNNIKSTIVDYAVKLVKHLELSGVITVETLVYNEDVYFWDVDLSLSDCSTLTELITGLNLYEYQFRIASGESLKLQQSDVFINNYAIGAFIRAEDPLLGFAPSVQKINRYLPSNGYGICLESAAYEGYTPPEQLGTSIGRLFSWGVNRDIAIHRIKRGLKEFIITGPRTNIPFFLFLLEHPQFTENQFHANFVEEEFSRLKLRQFYLEESRSQDLERAAITTALFFYLKTEEINLKSSDKNISNWTKYHRFWETAYKE